ncbi:MAG: hypothetical protein QXU20_03765 [Candidatus Woesearchaeota archaeon]
MKKAELKTTGWLLIIIVAIFLAWNAGWLRPPTPTPTPTPTPQPQPQPTTCPSTGLTNLRLEVINTANETGSESFDVTAYLYKINNGVEEYVTTITDTTNPAAIAIDCGYDYVLKPVSTDGASGNSGKFTKVISGSGSIRDGWLYFSARSANQQLIVGMDQHATLQCRAYDNKQKGLVFNDDDASNTDYEGDGVVWTSTINNSSPTNEALGIDFSFDCVAVQTDTNYNDRGVWVLIEAPTTTWSTPVVYVNGNRISESSGLMTPYEARAFANYEYKFLIPESVVIKDAGEGIDLRVVLSLLPGVTSANADPEIDLVPRGSYLSIDGVTVKVGAARDDSATTLIYSVYDMTIDVTE